MSRIASTSRFGKVSSGNLILITNPNILKRGDPRRLLQKSLRASVVEQNIWVSVFQKTRSPKPNNLIPKTDDLNELRKGCPG